MKKTSVLSCLRIGSLATAFVWLISANMAQAQLVALEGPNGFGNADQNNAAVNGGLALREQACVPTAITNGLSYLQSQLGGQFVSTSPYDTVNALATDMHTSAVSGTSSQNLCDGLVQYLSDNNIANQIGIIGGQSNGEVTGYNQFQNGSATAMYLYNALRLNESVTLGIDWSSQAQAETRTFQNGGHELTLEGISINQAGDAGTLTFLDPSGGQLYPPADWITLANGLIFLTGGINANNDDDPQHYTSAAVSFDVVLGSVPEPSVVYLAGIGLAALVVFRRTCQA